ncbi:OLC1v1027010C3 [Oldenlandia corymbosa var. corymbosa]|uniref:OLC1v1027010C3 n=1 Tax=Oldenlandia corymbosa var. corymbosa TaxID=529605 RepID=A0AAV1CB67_OLDCO|nr:OLC1v1027010C3 [Oldenlandia corymbosa var. corymbosa]
MASANLKQNIVTALCKHFSVDLNGYLRDVDSDLISLCTKILKSSANAVALLCNDAELTKWISFVESVTADSAKFLSDLNEELIKKSVLLGNGFKPSAADIIVFPAVHSVVVGLPNTNRLKLPHLMRWMDYIQNKVEFGNSFETILLEKVPFEPPVVKNVKKVEPEPTAKKTVQETKDAATAKAESKAVKPVEKKEVATGNQAAIEKKKSTEKETPGKDSEVSVSLLKIQIGLVRKASQHPSADSLLVEEIDVGEGKNRQVVSGLAKHISPEQLTNRYVVLITNVKPSKLRDVMSEGLVLCASNQDHSVVEPLIVPEGAKVGECVTFLGFEGKPEDVLNPKKKQLDKITPHLSTDSSGIATYKGVPFMTSAGPCKSSIPNGSVK